MAIRRIDTDTTTPPEPQETREVRVDEPGLTPETNAALTEDLRQAVGRDEVRVPVARSHPSQGEPAPTSPPADRLHPRSFLMVMIGAAGLVLGAIVALATGQWWLLPLCLIVLYTATFVVVRVVLGMTANPERPSPTTVAAMEEEGVRDPERYFSDLVDEFTEDRDERQERTTEAHDDPAQSAAEHRSAMTPSGGPTTPVGPGDTE